MRRSTRGLIAIAATVAALIGGQVAMGSAQAATTVNVNPATPGNDGQSAPFGESDVWAPYTVWIYKNVPSFSLQPGDTVSFDLSSLNNVDIQLQIDMAAATVNGGDQNAGSFTQVVPNTQVPANPRGNTVTGDYELTFTATAPFNFAGGGLLIRFGHAAGAFATDADGLGSGVLQNDALSTDASGNFVARTLRDADGVWPWTGDEYLGSIGGFRLVIADVPATPPPAPSATAPTKKKCKKKHRSAAAAKKCKKKRR